MNPLLSSLLFNRECMVVCVSGVFERQNTEQTLSRLFVFDMQLLPLFFCTIGRSCDCACVSQIFKKKVSKSCRSFSVKLESLVHHHITPDIKKRIKINQFYSKNPETTLLFLFFYSLPGMKRCQLYECKAAKKQKKR